MFGASLPEWLLGIALILSAIAVISMKNPVHSCICFLLTLLLLASLYLQLSAEFIAVMQILVYAGAILVIFMFVIVLFQDAHAQISHYPPKSRLSLLYSAIALSLFAFAALAYKIYGSFINFSPLDKTFGSVESIGKALYIDFFFPFEAIIFLFLVALIGTVYLAKKETQRHES
jgi:NADH-quinone oxidoreductase subunit J